MEHGNPFFHNGQDAISSLVGQGSSMLQQVGDSKDKDTRTPTTLNPPENHVIVPRLTIRDKSSLPLKNVAKIMRKGLPPYIKISDGAKEMAEQSASKFISLITKKAIERCLKESRKIVGAEDLLWAMMTLGYHNYFESLSFYLQRYRYSNEIMPMQLVDENPKPTLLSFEISNPSLPPPSVDVDQSSLMNRNTSIEIVEAMDMDEFWDKLGDLSVGSLGSASTNFDPFSLSNIGGMSAERYQ